MPDWQIVAKGGADGLYFFALKSLRGSCDCLGPSNGEGKPDTRELADESVSELVRAPLFIGTPFFRF